MKSFSLAVLLAAAHVLAAPSEPQPTHGVIPGEPLSIVSKRQNGNQGEGKGFGSCNKSPVFRSLRKDCKPVTASAFCSSYIRPTATVSTTVSVVTTATLTERTTTTETTTVTSVATAEPTTVTCAAQPTAPPTCGVEGFGFGNFLIGQTLGVDPVDCHLSCLADINCQSFQVSDGGLRVCNLFNVATAGNIQPAPGGGFTFYDRNCPDLLPIQCTSAALNKRQNGPLPTPTYFATVPPSQIASACSCFITASALTTTTTTVTKQTTIPTTITATVVTTQVVTSVVATTTTSTVIVTAPP